jgi:hypothetical protein
MVFSRKLDEFVFLYTEHTDITVPSVKGRKSSVWSVREASVYESSYLPTLRKPWADEFIGYTVLWTGCIFCLCKVEQSLISRNIPSMTAPAFVPRSFLLAVLFRVCGVITRRVSHASQSCCIAPEDVYCVETALSCVQKVRFRSLTAHPRWLQIVTNALAVRGA